METKIIDGKAIASKIREELKMRVKQLKIQKDITPGLVVILVGQDPASQIYVSNKGKACQQIGIASRVYRLPENTSQEELLLLISKLNCDKEIHGILVQLPLPKHIDEFYVLHTIDPKKDVDGFHPTNAGKLFSGQKTIIPCTPKGIMKMIYATKYKIQGKHAVVIGRSNIVGKPMALLLLGENATVTICHSKTIHIAEFTHQADILIAAVGKPGFVTGDMIKPGAFVVDVGTTRVDEKLKGDVDFETAKSVAGFLTPVPGGVGPMTITMLLENTIEAGEQYE